MSKIAIRDDDTSFFTQPEDLDRVYSEYWGIIPISLAVIPFSVPEHQGRNLAPSYRSNQSMPLADNKRLVNYLREKIQDGHAEIMLHGHTHEYKKIGGRWKGEYAWKTKAQLETETARGLQYLQELLKTTIKVFVPPSNQIGTGGTQAIRKASLNLSGILGRGGDRPITPDYLQAYCKRWFWRIKRGSPYPYPLCYGGHTELTAHALTPRSDQRKLLAELEHCINANAPFVLATHYWEFNDAPSMHSKLAEIIQIADDRRLTFSTVSNCFD